MFDTQPRLRGELVELRPLRASDEQALYRVASDPLIWAQHPNRDRHELGPFREYFRDALGSANALVVIERASGEIIGATRYHGYDAERSEVEIGWTFLARRCWGGRFNGEVKRLMLDHAFRSLERVVFFVGENNVRSQRAVHRIGGVPDGTIELQGPDGRPIPSVRYFIVRSGQADKR